jgi:hypothetical protein
MEAEFNHLDHATWECRREAEASEGTERERAKQRGSTSCVGRRDEGGERERVRHGRDMVSGPARSIAHRPAWHTPGPP